MWHNREARVSAFQMQGTLLNGRYKIIRVLGAGGFGQTYLAEDIQRPEISPCVIKQFKPASRDDNFLKIARRLFQTEVEILERLGQHDQIPSFYGSFEENREFYLVQEFIDGTALADELDQTRQLTETQVINLLKDLLHVLEFVHGKHVIHRDIKPENLIRRHRDGKYVLIDFGAVKEIRTQIVDETGQTRLTVGIGTEGYTPSEQLSGKPRYCSDIYALGITAIQALTGLQPYQLREDIDTGDLIWRDQAHVSLGLALILERMVRFHFNNRYQTATDVLKSLDQLASLPTNLTSIPESELFETLGIESATDGHRSSDPMTVWKTTVAQSLRMVAIATLAVSGLILSIRQLGWLQRFELVAYDRMVQLAPDRGPDPRLLLVGITEENLRQLQRATPSDAAVAQVIQTLQQHDPRAIGLNLYRDIGEGDGRDALLQALEAPNVVAIMNLGSSDDNFIPAPPGVPNERVGFNDFPIDGDGTVRRSLLIGTVENAGAFNSFALQIALRYLAEEGIEIQNNPDNIEEIQLGDVPLPRLTEHAGGYQNEDAGGYQIMLDYRSADNFAPQMSFVDVLNGDVDPEQIRDKVILIGTVAESSRDFFPTPYSAGRDANYEMPGVAVHTQMVSQLLSVGLGERSLIRYLPGWGEMLWIIGWSAVGGVMAIFLRHPIALGIGSMVLVLMISGVAFFSFSRQVWIPAVPPAIAAIVTGGAVVAYRAYTTQRDHEAVTSFLRHNQGETLMMHNHGPKRNPDRH